MPDPTIVPQSYLDMPGWWNGRHADWLAGLPDLIEAQCCRWGLSVDGAVMHGSNALVIPVVRAGEELVLRLAVPDQRTVEEIAALRFWDGRGTARLVDADPAVSAMLMERIVPGTPASVLPVAECMTVVGRMMRRLAVPDVPDGVPSTAEIVIARGKELDAEWERLDRPFPVELLRLAAAAADRLSVARDNLATNGDLHSDQILQAAREPWLVVDMLLYRGDIEYDLARALWMRIDDMPADADIVASFRTVVRAAGLDEERARTWVLYRTVDYWLWGLSAGLTEDPVRCRRLLTAFGLPS